ncbi:unnamed protein product, partial [Laminaria digitata]
QVVVPYLGNITGGRTTPDVTGRALKGVLFDISHLGLSCQDNLNLVDLPVSYTELYGAAKSPHASATASAAAAAEGGRDTAPAVCLVCGQVLAAGFKPPDNMGAIGECTLHARECGSGVGVFFLVQSGYEATNRYQLTVAAHSRQSSTMVTGWWVNPPPPRFFSFYRGMCVVLLIRDSRAAYFPSIYVDDHGEEDAGLKRGRPLFLNKHRYDALKQVYLRHRVGHEVSAIRASSDRVIRENYY